MPNAKPPASSENPPAPEPEQDTRPPALQMFDLLGLREQVTISQIRTIGGFPGDALDEAHEVVQIIFAPEIVVRVRPIGVGGPPRNVRWAAVTSFIVH